MLFLTLFFMALIGCLVAFAVWNCTWENRKVTIISAVLSAVAVFFIACEIESASSKVTAREYQARKQAIELVINSDNYSDEMKIAYAHKISEFNEELLQDQAYATCWWNLPFLHSTILEITPIE